MQGPVMNAGWRIPARSKAPSSERRVCAVFLAWQSTESAKLDSKCGRKGPQRKETAERRKQDLFLNLVLPSVLAIRVKVFSIQSLLLVFFFFYFLVRYFAFQ